MNEMRSNVCKNSFFFYFKSILNFSTLFLSFFSSNFSSLFFLPLTIPQTQNTKPSYSYIPFTTKINPSHFTAPHPV